jgi:hypothetical protein
MMPTGAAEDDSARADRITDRYHVLRSPRLSRANPRVFSRCRNSQSSSRNDAFVLALGAGRHQPCDAVTPRILWWREAPLPGARWPCRRPPLSYCRTDR